MQCWLEEEKETGDGLATIAAVLAQRRGNSLAATVAVLAPEEKTERRRFSDYNCSVWCAKEKRKDDDYSTVAVLGAKEKDGYRWSIGAKRDGR